MIFVKSHHLQLFPSAIILAISKYNISTLSKILLVAEQFKADFLCADIELYANTWWAEMFFNNDNNGSSWDPFSWMTKTCLSCMVDIRAVHALVACTAHGIILFPWNILVPTPEGSSSFCLTDRHCFFHGRLTGMNKHCSLEVRYQTAYIQTSEFGSSMCYIDE